MSEIETHPAAEKPFCDPGKETQTPVINDKSDLAKHIDANRGSSNKNQTISRPTRNELSQFSESNKTKHKINSHKLSVVKPKPQVRKVKKKRFFLISPPGYQARPFARHSPGVGRGSPRRRHRDPRGHRGGARPLIGQAAEYWVLIGWRGWPRAGRWGWLHQRQRGPGGQADAAEEQRAACSQADPAALGHCRVIQEQYLTLINVQVSRSIIW